MALVTGSVVVPGVADTNAVSCPVKALTRLDFSAVPSSKDGNVQGVGKFINRGVLFRINPEIAKI